MTKKILLIVIGVVFLAVAGLGLTIITVAANLPKLVTVDDYHPFVVSQVFDVTGDQIGEFYRERRIVMPLDKMPKKLIDAFLSAEDSSFYQHGGINYLSIIRAFWANVRAGRTVQGGSTITQQVAKSLILKVYEKTLLRKVREVMLSYRMEENLKKDEILYLYLNQIYLGQSAYGVEAAAQTYFHKSVKDLTVPEAAILAGMPQAPSRYSPVSNPLFAKQRQRYVIRRMEETGSITAAEAKAAAESPVTFYSKRNYKEVAPYFLETVRQYLVQTLGEEMVLDQGIRIYTTVDSKKQLVAQEEVRKGLRDLDKRQGYRGVKEQLKTEKEIEDFLAETRDNLIDEKTPVRILKPDGTVAQVPIDKSSAKPAAGPHNIPEYVNMNEIVDAIVTKIDDKWGLTTVRFAGAQGLIDIETMRWARKPNPEVRWMNAQIDRPSRALNVGDVIQVKVVGEKFKSERISNRLVQLKKAQKTAFKPPQELPKFEEYCDLQLEQEPLAEGALLSLDMKTQNVVAMVGGYDFEKSEFNRAIQAGRQTGSSFKPIVYLAAMDAGFTPSSTIIDAPVVYQQEALSKFGNTESESDDPKQKAYKPGNYNQKFVGDMLFRNALIQSKNIPTLKIEDEIGVDRVATYARRLGIFSPLNMDITLGLGSSSVTLYEMTKVFSTFANNGRRVHPKMILSVRDSHNKVLLDEVSLDKRFEKDLKKLDEDFEVKRVAYLEKMKSAPTATTLQGTPETKISMKSKTDYPLYFNDPEQLISPQSAFLITSLLQGVIRDPGGTGAKARSLGRPLAGKTGTTNGYYDSWFIGFSPQISTGVWVGFDDEKTLGASETGAEAALPIWMEYMKAAHEGVDERDFAPPPKIVFANIDNETGKPASAGSKVVIRQAYLEGTEPGSAASNEATPQGEKDFYKEDLVQ